MQIILGILSALKGISAIRDLVVKFESWFLDWQRASYRKKIDKTKKDIVDNLDKLKTSSRIKLNERLKALRNVEDIINSRNK